MFTDIQNDWAKPCIVQLEQRQIVSGYPDGTFRPQASLTRAEFTVLMNRLFPNVAPTQPAVSFTDLPQSHWAYGDIQTATQKRFFSGYPDGTFQPNRSLSRLQAIVVLASTRPNPPTADPQLLTRYYDDAAEIPNWAKTVMAQATATNLVVNSPPIRKLRPQQNVTRGEAAALSCRALSIDAIPPDRIVGFPPPPTQPRQLLNQTPETIQSYFGFPLSEERQENQTVFSYVATGIWQLSPGYEEGGSFSVVFDNNRSTSVKIFPGGHPQLQFSYDIGKVFRYLFGYSPKKIEDVPGWYGGGHEGFYIEKKCLGDGLMTEYMESNLGITNIYIYADSTCR